MQQKEKVMMAADGSIDLRKFAWDRGALCREIQKDGLVEVDIADKIASFLKSAIIDLDVEKITVAMVNEMAMAKFAEYGIENAPVIKVKKSMFLENGLHLTKNAITVLERRYLKKDDDGNVKEAPVDMFRRVARHIAMAEKNYGDAPDLEAIEKKFYDLMASRRFLPNSPTLMNADRRLGQLAACFVLPVEDSMEGIFESLKNAAIIHKSGGGTGFSFSRLRPKNSTVGTTGGIASGPVSFMKIFNTATEQVKQGGTRRGANMAILRVDHPDVMEFIHCKKINHDLNNFNISVGLTESFMEAVKQDKEYDLICPVTGEKAGELMAAEVYNALVLNAWKNGDPGIIFLDRINRDNPTPLIGEIESTNPCGEQPLLPGEACNLGSINLSMFVARTDTDPSIDFSALRETVWTSIRFLDNTIDMSRYPLEEISKMVRANRKVGLGVMGFADLLFQLNIPYNSDAALELAEEIMGFIQDESHKASRELALERGLFENFEKSIFKEREDCNYRNATTTTIAPTGTLSIIANCSSGVEPLFALSFTRNVMDNDKLTEVNPYFEAVARQRGFYSEQLMEQIAKEGGIAHMDGIPDDVKAVFVTAHEVSPEWHLKMQAAFQKYTDNAVSKTVNLSHDATADDVAKIYNLAFELGCKGVTIYRDGSKENQVLSFSNKEQKDDRFMRAVKDRPETLEGFTTRIKTGLGQLYLTVTEYEGKPFEVFATIGKSGRSTTAKTEAIGRLVSLALRSGVTADKVVEQLKGIGGEHPVFQEGGLVLSIPDAIARVLEKRYMKNPRKSKNKGKLMGEICPECGQTISFEEGCMMCHFCGYTKCG